MDAGESDTEDTNCLRTRQAHQLLSLYRFCSYFPRQQYICQKNMISINIKTSTLFVLSLKKVFAYQGCDYVKTTVVCIQLFKTL